MSVNASTLPLPLRRMLPPVLIALVCMLVLMMFWRGVVLNDDYLPVNELQLIGEFDQLDADAIKALIEPDLRGNFFALPVEQIHALVAAQPWVDRVWVDRVFPDTVRLRISEQKPVARWGSAALVNQRGEMFVTASDGFENLPLLQGPEQSMDEVLAFFKQASRVLQGSGLNIREMTMDERRSWRMLVNETTVMLGREQLEQRLQRLQQYWQRALAADSRQVDRIDLRYANGFAVRWSDRLKPVNAVKS